MFRLHDVLCNGCLSILEVILFIVFKWILTIIYDAEKSLICILCRYNLKVKWNVFVILLNNNILKLICFSTRLEIDI